MLKGASSVLYGQGETRVLPSTSSPSNRCPTGTPPGSVTAGSYGYVSPSIDVSGPLTSSKALRFRLNAAYQQEDSFVDFVDSERYIIAPVLALSIGPTTQLTLEGEYQALGELYWTGLPADGTIFGNPNGKIPLSRYLGDPELEGDNFPERTIAKLGYRLDHRFNEYVSLRQGFRFTYQTRDERDILGFALQPDQRTFDRDLFVAKGWWRDYYVLTDLMFDFKTGPLGHKLLFGTDQRFLSTSDRSATDALPPIDVTYIEVWSTDLGRHAPQNLQQSGTFIGIYAQDLVTIIDQVKLLVGGRYDLATFEAQNQFTDSNSVTRSESDDSVFTPRVGLVHRPVLSALGWRVDRWHASAPECMQSSYTPSLGAGTYAKITRRWMPSSCRVPLDKLCRTRESRSSGEVGLPCTPTPAHRREGRKLWLKIHRAIAFVVGRELALVGFSGSLLVFYKAIDAWLNPGLPTTNGRGPRTSIDDIFATVRAAVPQAAGPDASIGVHTHGRSAFSREADWLQQAA